MSGLRVETPRRPRKRRAGEAPANHYDVLKWTVEDAVLFHEEADHAAREFERSGGEDMADVFYLQKSVEAGRGRLHDLEALVGSDVVASLGEDAVRSYAATIDELRRKLRYLIELGRERAPILFVDEVAEQAVRKSAETRAAVYANPPRIVYALRVPGARGPPKLTVTNADSLRLLSIELRLSFDAIAHLLNDERWHDPSVEVKGRTIKRICLDLGIKAVERPEIDHVQLSTFINYWRTENNNTNDGIVSIMGALRQANVPHTYRAVARLLRAADPVGSRMRFMEKVKRRVYNVVAANVLWHFDGNHKLKRYNFVLHGGIDGYSRRIVWMKIASDNYSDTVFRACVEAMTKYGAPRLIRSDYGRENVKVWNLADSMRVNLGYRIKVLRGRSVHNQRIERTWGELSRWIRSTVEYLGRWEQEIGLNPGNPDHLLALHYVMLPHFTRKLDEWTAAFNEHTVRTTKQTPRSMFEASLRARRRFYQPIVVRDGNMEHIQTAVDELNALELSDAEAAMDGYVEDAAVPDEHDDAENRFDDAMDKIVIHPPLKQFPWWDEDCTDALEGAVPLPEPQTSFASYTPSEPGLRTAWADAVQVIQEIRRWKVRG